MSEQPSQLALRRPWSALLDRAGVVASITCAIHCALMPLLVSVLPLAGVGLLAEESAETGFVGAAIAIGLLSLVPSYLQRHGRARPLVIFVGGVAAILLARSFFEESSSFEIPLVVTGAILIATAHVLNGRLCRSCEHC